MLNKQSIRGNIQIFIDNELSTKEQVIALSEGWNPKEETLFRRMLKQGGSFKIKGQQFKILIEEQLLNSRGNSDSAIRPMDHSGGDIDLNYLR